MGDKDIFLALQITVRNTALMNRFNDCQHLCKVTFAVVDRAVTQCLRVDIFEHQVAEAVGDAAYSREAFVYQVLTPQHTAIQPGREPATRCRLDQYSVFTDLAGMDIALISAVIQLLTVGHTGKNVRLGDSGFVHSLV